MITEIDQGTCILALGVVSGAIYMFIGFFLVGLSIVFFAPILKRLGKIVRDKIFKK